MVLQNTLREGVTMRIADHTLTGVPIDRAAPAAGTTLAIRTLNRSQESSTPQAEDWITVAASGDLVNALAETRGADERQIIRLTHYRQVGQRPWQKSDTWHLIRIPRNGPVTPSRVSPCSVQTIHSEVAQ